MKYSRKTFLKKIFGGSLAIAGFTTLAACNGSRTEKQAPALKESPQKADCSDLSMLTADELKVRQQFGYESPSTSPDRQCQHCSLYFLASAEKPCAGCLLFNGPVSSDGSCMQFAAKVQQ